MPEDIEKDDDVISIPDWGPIGATMSAMPAGVPYKLNWDVSGLDAGGHTLILAPAGRGMTCSSVMDLMAAGLGKWPRRSKGWRRHLRGLKARERRT